jgi:transcriptional regulator with XRE-family HTH domain
MTIAELVKEKRKENRMSQLELAIQMGVFQKDISRIENGAEICASRLIELAKLLDIDLNKLKQTKSMGIY